MLPPPDVKMVGDAVARFMISKVFVTLKHQLMIYFYTEDTHTKIKLLNHPQNWCAYISSSILFLWNWPRRPLNLWSLQPSPLGPTHQTRQYLQRLDLLGQNLMGIVDHRRGWAFLADVLNPLLHLNRLVQVLVRIFWDSATNHRAGALIVGVMSWGQTLWWGGGNIGKNDGQNLSFTLWRVQAMLITNLDSWTHWSPKKPNQQQTLWPPHPNTFQNKCC